MQSVTQIHSEICDSIKELYAKKNADYGDAFAKARKEVPCYTLGKLHDKFNRYKTLASGKEASVKDETIADTLLDMANYCIMELAEMKYDECNKTEKQSGCTCNECVYTHNDSDNMTDIFEAKAYKKRVDGSLAGFKAVISVNSRHNLYHLTTYVPMDYYDNDTFIIDGLNKLVYEIRDYANNPSVCAGYIRWDSNINVCDIWGESVQEVYEKFLFAIETLKEFYCIHTT